MQNLLKETKRIISSIGIISLLLGSIFALCYTPFMKMASLHNPTTQAGSISKSGTQCCGPVNTNHHLTVTGIMAPVSALENLLLLLGLGLLLFVAGTVKKLEDTVKPKLDRLRQLIYKLFYYLIEAFSSGLLHPKLYHT